MGIFSDLEIDLDLVFPRLIEQAEGFDRFDIDLQLSDIGFCLQCSRAFWTKPTVLFPIFGNSCRSSGESVFNYFQPQSPHPSPSGSGKCRRRADSRVFIVVWRKTHPNGCFKPALILLLSTPVNYVGFLMADPISPKYAIQR